MKFNDLHWVVFVGIVFSPFLGLGATTLDPHIGILQKLYPSQKISSKNVHVGKNENATAIANDRIVGVFIKTSNLVALKSFLKQNFGVLNSVIGDIVTAQMPLSSIAELKNLEGVQYVELAQPIKTSLNVSRALIGADLVQNGTNLSRSYTGKGVIVGIVDTGIDWRHYSFRDATGGSRVKAIWDQSLSPISGFVGPREMTSTYGLECVERDLDLGNYSLCPSEDRDGHGTHVAGIAAGNDSTFKGIAPDAEIIAVKIPEAAGVTGDYTFDVGVQQSFSNHVVDGMNYIFQKAAALGMPAVINLSLGSHFGPHDSTSLFEQALNNLAIGASGRSIVAAAGNETNISGSYFASVHAGFPLQDETKAIEFISKATLLHSLIIDVWQPAESNLSFGIGIDNYKAYQRTPMIAPGASTTFSTADGDLNILVDSTEIQNPLNGKKHTLIYIVAAKGNDGVSIAASKYVFDLIVSGRGNFDAWIALGGTFTKRTGILAHTGFAYQAGDSQRTVAVPATASKILTVASYSSRNNFDNMSGLTGWLPDIASLIVGNVSSFSSIGPTANSDLTGQKPEIVAPGEWIFSAMSSASSSRFVNQDWPRAYGNVLLAGTSMAAPHVTGAIALMFEQHRSLTADEVKRRLFLTVDSGQGVGLTPLPNNRSGYGKINVSRAMEYDDFVSVGFDFNSRTFSVSSETVPETAYDGGTTDAKNSGLTSSNVTKRDELEAMPVFANGLDGNSVDDFSNDPLTPVGGGCSLVFVRKNSDASAMFLFFVFIIPVLFLLWKKRELVNRVHFISAILALVILSSCGGGGSDASPQQSSEPVNTSNPSSGSANTPVPQDAPINLLASLDLSKEQGQIFVQSGLSATVTVSADRTKAFVLFMPFKHLFVGETVALGADGLYGLNPDEGFLVIYEGKNIGDKNAKITSNYVVTSGTFSLNEASIRQGEKLSGSFQVNQIAPLDLATSLIQRGKEQVTLSSSFSAIIAVGGTSDPYIMEYSPKNLQKGGEISIKGLNFRDVKRIWFKNCGVNFPLPFQVVSDNLLKVSVNQFGCKIKDALYLSMSNSTFSYTAFATDEEFEVQIPYLQNFSAPGIYLNTGSMIYDPSRQFVYLEDTAKTRLRVFSIVENKFLTTVYSSRPFNDIGDVTFDGTLLATINRSIYSRSVTLFNLNGVGESGNLNGSPLITASASYFTGDFFLGKGRKGLMGADYGLKLIDLNLGTVSVLPSELSSNLPSNSASLIRSPNRKYIILNVGVDNFYSAAATTVYHSLDSGEFEKISSVQINKKILGIAEIAQELWSTDSIFNVNLTQQGSYGAGIPDWNTSTAAGIVFDPSNTYAILISNKGVVHVLNRATRAVLVTNVPVINIQNKSLSNQYIMSNDGARLILSSENYLHSIDLKALFQSVGLPYPI